MSIVTIEAGTVGADWAYLGIKTPDTLAANGVTHVTRYITRGNSSKALKPAERDMLLAAGIRIVLCWETTATAALAGAGQGHLDGLEAAKQAALLGYPLGLPILAAVDTDTVASNAAQVNAYLRAFYVSSNQYGPGLYGDEDAYALVADLDPVWCLPNALGWSPRLWLWFRGLLSIFGFGFKGHIRQGRQDTTLGWDFPNKVTKAFPAWGPDVPAPPPPPIVIPVESAPPVLITITPDEEDGDDMSIVCNQEPLFGLDPTKVKFLVTASGKLRHLEYTEWVARGSDEGVPLTNAQISELGTV